MVQVLETSQYRDRPVVSYMRMCLDDKEFDVFPRSLDKQLYGNNPLLLLTVVTSYINNRIVPDEFQTIKMIRSIGDW